MRRELGIHVGRSVRGLGIFRKATVLSIVAGVGLACSEEAMDGAVTSPIAPSHAPSLSSTNASANFHAKNHLDWVGRAHNKALSDFAAMVKAKGAPKDLCAALMDFMSAAERLPGKGNKGDAASRRATTAGGLRATDACKRRFVTSLSSSWLAAAVEEDSFSYAANRLFDRIKAAQSNATTSGELAGYLSLQYFPRQTTSGRVTTVTPFTPSPV